MGFGSVKNVGIAVIEDLVRERTENGNFKDFIDFCERMNKYSINKKCIESLIKAGAFDEFKKTRSTLLASYENIIDGINSLNRNKIENQVSMFDIINEGDLNSKKYKYTELKELETKEFLSFEKEMLGVYFSGHPLNKYKNKIRTLTNFSSLNIIEINEEIEETGNTTLYKDGQNVKIIGIVSKVRKKITKKNSIMAFITLDDLHGSFETIAFESTWGKFEQYLSEEKIVLIEGRLSIREDEPVKIIIMNVREIVNEDEEGYINIDISDFSEKQKEDLRTLIRFYSKMNNANTRIDVTVNGEIRSCGKVLLNKDNRKRFEAFM